MATVYVEEKKKLRGIRSMLLAVTAVNAVLSLALGMISSFAEVSVPMYLQALIAGLGAYVIPIMLYARQNGVTAEGAAERFYLRKCGGLNMLLAFLMGAGFQFVMVLVNLPLNMLMKSADVYSPSSPQELAAAMLIIAVLPAVFEELLFRGIVYGSMAEFNIRAAAVFSAVMFAVMHSDLYSIPGYLLMGFVLAFTVRRADSLYAAMLFHFANNAAALALAYFNDALWYSPEVMIILCALGIMCFIIAAAAFAGVNKKAADVRRIKTATLLGQSFISIPIVLCIGVLVISKILMRVI